jgi:hypothetical protein
VRTAAPAGAATLFRRLEGATPAERGRTLRDAGRLLRRVHEAGYACRGRFLDHVAVRSDTGAVVLTSVDGVRRTPGSPDRLARRDLSRLTAAGFLRAADRLRFVLGYYGLERMTPPVERLLRQWSRRSLRRAARERRVA